MLLVALAAIVPGLSIAAGLLLIIPAFQMIAGKSAPVFPGRIATRLLPTRHLAAVVQRFVPVRRYLEKVIHPRWHSPLGSPGKPAKKARKASSGQKEMLMHIQGKGSKARETTAKKPAPKQRKSA